MWFLDALNRLRVMLDLGISYDQYWMGNLGWEECKLDMKFYLKVWISNSSLLDQILFGGLNLKAILDMRCFCKSGCSSLSRCGFVVEILFIEGCYWFFRGMIMLLIYISNPLWIWWGIILWDLNTIFRMVWWWILLFWVMW